MGSCVRYDDVRWSVNVPDTERCRPCAPESIVSVCELSGRTATGGERAREGGGERPMARAARI